MYIRHLSLVDFRSWTSAELALEPGVNVLVGRNGVGKTNLVEAIGYLATLGSFRVATDAPLLRRGCDQAIVRGAVVSEGRELLLEIALQAGKANKARLNRSPLTRPRDLLGIVRVVIFAPEDLALVKGDPSDRRRFLDEVLVMRLPRLAGARSDYDRALKQRNTLLKSAGLSRRSGGPDLSVLKAWDDQLATAGAELLDGRLDLVEAMNPLVSAAYADVAPASAPVQLRYRSSLGELMPAERSVENLREALLTAMELQRSAEIDRGISLVGPHRDELELILGEGPAKGYASHGESWSFALALRLGSFALLREDGVNPILVLDDVFAELDAGRRSALASLVTAADQVLITAAVAEDIPAVLSGRRVSVSPGTIETSEPIVDPVPADEAVVGKLPVAEVTVTQVIETDPQEEQEAPDVR